MAEKVGMSIQKLTGDEVRPCGGMGMEEANFSMSSVEEIVWIASKGTDSSGRASWPKT
jgi:hypothetical protein